jgi:hypothetical protein
LETFKSFVPEIYTVNELSFPDIALKAFQFQAAGNQTYKAFIKHLGLSPPEITSIEQIPFLPISFFKSREIKTGDWVSETTFTSSSTTGSKPSIHSIPDVQFYLQHARKCFEYFFGPITNYHFLALLPSYLERQGSSLVVMMDHFIRGSHSHHSGFYLNDYEAVIQKIQLLKNDPRKTILWGVTFALLDLAERYEIDLDHCIVVETGGMKGRRKEITRNELQDILREKLNVKRLFSEYGMTELLSQAYLGTENSRFLCPPWMRVICRDITDPLKNGLQSEMGGINVIDLANWQTLSFIETEDLGKVHTDGSFEVLGRLDNSDLRGCNLMV